MNKQIIIVLILIVLDIITGIMKACKTGTLNSSILREGLWHKGAEVTAMVCAWIFEYIPPAFEIAIELPLLTPVCIYIVLMEVLSVIENICVVNEQMNALFEPYLEKLKGSTGAKDE